MTSEDRRNDGTDDDAGGESEEATVGPSSSEEQAADPASEDRTRRPLLAGVIGLLAGIAGGIAGTTIAPDSVLLTIVLVVAVAGVVTIGALRLLARRG